MYGEIWTFTSHVSEKMFSNICTAIKHHSDLQYGVKHYGNIDE